MYNIQKTKSNAFCDFQFCNANLKFDFHIWLMSFASIPGHWPSKLLLHSMSRLTTRNLILIFWGTLNLAFWHFCTLCKTLKGRVFTKTGERHFSKWHFGDHSSSWTHAPNPKNVKSDNTAEILLVAQAIYLANWGGLTFLLALLGTGALGMYKTRNERHSKPDIWKAPLWYSCWFQISNWYYQSFTIYPNYCKNVEK